MFDVVALGELLVDFTPNGQSEQGNALLEVNPGGAPCNVLAMLSKLGHKTAFLGKVGNDQFGGLLRETVTQAGIETKGLLSDQKVHTTLAFVHLDEHGDRSFSFCRNPGADMMLTAAELDMDILRQAKIFHFGTLSMTAPEIRHTTMAAISAAKQAGSLISFDPNLRPPLWDSLDTAKEMILYGTGQADIMKISEEELEFITGIADLDQAAAQLLQEYPNLKVLFVTLGKEGSSFYFRGQKGSRKTFSSVKTIDTTGAGDTFCGCILHYILKYGIDGLSFDVLMELLAFGNAASSLVTTKKGAIRAMPSLGEIQALIETEQ